MKNMNPKTIKKLKSVGFIVCVIFLVCSMVYFLQRGCTSDQNFKQLMQAYPEIDIEYTDVDLDSEDAGVVEKASSYAILRHKLKKSDDDYSWSLIASEPSSGSEWSQEQLESFEYIAVAHSSYTSANYKGAHSGGTKRSESVTIWFFNTKVRAFTAKTTIEGIKLPEKTTSTDDYTIPNNEIIKTVKEKLTGK